MRYQFLARLLANKEVRFLGNAHPMAKEISVKHPILQQLWRRELAAKEQVRLCICPRTAALAGIPKGTRAPAHRHTLLTSDLLMPDSLLLKSVKSNRSKTKVCRRSRRITRRLPVKKNWIFQRCLVERGGRVSLINPQLPPPAEIIPCISYAVL